MVTGDSGKRRADAGKSAPAAPGVGGHVNAYCGKCKDSTSHIILAQVAGKPTRVECRVCHAMHAYKTGATSRPASTRSPRTARAAEPSPQEAWTSAMRSARGDAIPYVTSGRFAVGNRLKHPTFGEGVVVRLPSATVCEVVFVTGTVKLIMGASAPNRGR